MILLPPKLKPEAGAPKERGADAAGVDDAEPNPKDGVLPAVDEQRKSNTVGVRTAPSIPTQTQSNAANSSYQPFMQQADACKPWRTRHPNVGIFNLMCAHISGMTLVPQKETFSPAATVMLMCQKLNRPTCRCAAGSKAESCSCAGSEA